MRKIFNKALAGITSIALVATMLVGVNAAKTVKADDSVSLAKWSFVQGGQFNDGEPENAGYINKVTMAGTNETVSGWSRGDNNIPADRDPSFNQEKTANNVANGFDLDIERNSWDCMWKDSTGYETNRINPWTIRAEMRNVPCVAGHTYTVSFKARATSVKYCYVSFSGTVIDNAGQAVSITPYEGDTLAGSNPLIKLGQQEQTFTYTFTNWTSVEAFTTTLSLGSFNAKYDYAGNYVGDIITSEETQWKGNVYVSDFTITDNGQNPEFETDPPKADEPATEAPTVKPTAKPTVKPTTKPAAKKLAKVKKLSVKNTKKSTIKVSWKKVKNAKTYQIKVNGKTYSTGKLNKTIKSKKFKKGKKITVQVRAKAKGYKQNSWTKKSIKIKK